MLKIRRLYSLVFIALLQFSVSCAQPINYAKEHYNKAEFRITMRDGVKLHTIVYSPKDTSIDYPIMFFRTPYTIYPYDLNEYNKVIGPSEEMMKEGYIFVYQDVRGKFMSEGEFVDVRPYIPNKQTNSDIDESSDAYDSIDWLIKNVKHNNGKVGMWGISYPGFYAAMAAIDAHPALKAVSPQAPIADWFVADDFHHYGTLFISHAFDFMSVFGQPRSGLTKNWGNRFVYNTEDGFDFFLKMGALRNANDVHLKHKIPFWNDLEAHPNYDDFWQKRNTLPHFKNIKPAIMVVGGLFDAEDLYGALNTYKAIKKNTNSYCSFVFGPWYHGGWARSEGDKLGDISFGSKTGDYYKDSLETPFFNFFLKGKGNPPKECAHVFTTGINKWVELRELIDTPDNSAPTSLYFNKSGKLTVSDSFNGESGVTVFISDPSKPVPFSPKPVIKMTREYMVSDQRFVSDRKDVISFSTDNLQNDVTITGEMLADLFVSTTGTDADWIVKLIDVYPSDKSLSKEILEDTSLAGYYMLVRNEVLRGKYRNSLENPEPFIPGEITEVKLKLQAVNHTFRRNHKIMVQVQSSWFHLIDRNPQKFIDIYKAIDSDYQTATHKIYFDAKHPSRLEIKVRK